VPENRCGDLEVKAVVIDTNVYCDAMRGEARASKLLRQAERILLPTVVFGELLAGFKGGNRERANKEQLIAFAATERVHTVPITTETAEFYALVIHQLRAKGTPIPTNDIWIAALTMEHGASLATADDHFSKIDGLNLYGG
jgi:tRNA(fMet)-specific endonuclease VapC